MRKRSSQIATIALAASCWADATLAAPSQILEGANTTKGSGTVTNLTGTTGAFHKISNTLIYLVGAVAVIMLIIGGLRYVTSQGDSSSVKAAKDTILYGVIGVIVAVLAYAIVSFVAGSL